MLQLLSNKPQPAEFDVMVNVVETDTAGKKETIRSALRSAIYAECRKYIKIRKLKRTSPFYFQERCVTFIIHHPNPPYGKIMTYRICIGPDGVQLVPATLKLDPDIAPFLDPVNLSQVENEYFNPADFHPNTRQLLTGRTAAPNYVNEPAETLQAVPVITLPETRFITATRMPKAGCRGQDRPFLQFGGTYLEKFGFTMGTPVNMHLEQNKITLTVATDQTNDRLSA